MSTPVSSTVCSLCGQMLEREGACLTCLLRGGLDESEKEPLPSNSLVFGDFEVERRDDGSFWELGRGAMGVTYRARDRMLHRQIALKVIEVPTKAEGARAMRERFLREARAAAALRHANVASVFQFGAPKETSRCYYAMELVEGETLATLVRRDGPLPVAAALDIAIQVTHALVAAAAHGLVHRDLKPANIMLAPNDATPAALEAKVIDFGLAKATAGAADEMDITHGAFVGTPTFASPEQFAGKAADARSDIYSLGVTLWYALTGEVPYPGKTIEEIRAAQKEVALPVHQLSARKVPAPLIKLLRQTLAINPVERIQSARALLGALELCRAKMAAAPRRRKAALLYGLLAIGAVGLTSYLRDHSSAPVIPPEKSIAVLPFENRSGNQASDYFAEGIQDEILTRLSKIADLKVISRTSTQRYQSKPRNLREIAKQLGVANILEGSVQKAADQVRVSVQLINAQTDSHVWAETFDRKLTDIFGVESEIAKGIAESLQAKLTGREEQALAVKPTNNPEAYDAYLRGLAFDARSAHWSMPLVREATGFYEEAVQLDPNFALAWARLSRLDALLYFNGTDTAGVARRDAAKNALENAQKLAANSPETLLALGYYQYWVLRDYGLAKTTFGRVSKMLPGSSEVPQALGSIARREGNWDQGIAHFEQALTLDPRNMELLMFTAWTYSMLRQFPAALKLYDRALDIRPNDPEVLPTKGGIYQAQGNLQEAAMLLSQISAQPPSWAWDNALIKLNQLRLERNYGEAVRFLQARLAQRDSRFPFDKARDQAWLALYQRLAGDTAGAKVTAEHARNMLEQLYRGQLDNADVAALLSNVYAAMGQKDSALRAAERAIILLPSAKDRVTGPIYEENLALTQTMVGENNRAISTLTQLLHTPCFSWVYGPMPITPALLRLDPFWDPLRADPAFQKLCEEKINKSIAVLPFENLSRDPDNAYFADGIQEEILTRLAKIADLKVISRTSTQRYQSKPRDLGEIAKQLGVANILEGSIQRVADQVRVNVQLINAQTDSHLWADTYDRKLTDILSVESEIAKRIAESLQAKLTGREEQALAVKPTNNQEAYDAYLRGLAYTIKTATAANYLGAQKYLREAVRLDPNFALAWALLSIVDAAGYLSGTLQPTVALREEARQAAETALTLQPDLGEALHAKGYYYYACLRDYDTAVRYFEQARQFLPNDSRILQSLGSLTRRQGQWDRSDSYFNEAERLDPRDVDTLTQRAFSYIYLRRFPEALRKLDQILNITPDDVDILAHKAAIAQAEGDLPRASALLAPLRPNADHLMPLETQVYQAILERRPAPIISRLKEILAKPDPALGHLNGELRFWLGWAQEVAGDHAAAQESWRQARSELEPFLKQQPENYAAHCDLAVTNMALGDKAAAFALAEQAMAAVPIEKDALDGPLPIEILARVAAQMGEPDRAIAALRKLLSIPYQSPFAKAVPPLTLALLRLDPMFDPLRSDPRFQKLCEKKQP